MDLKVIAEEAVKLLEAATPLGSVVAPLVTIAESIFEKASAGVASSDLADLKVRVDAAEADRASTWTTAEDALAAAAKR